MQLLAKFISIALCSSFLLGCVEDDYTQVTHYTERTVVAPGGYYSDQTPRQHRRHSNAPVIKEYSSDRASASIAPHGYYSDKTPRKHRSRVPSGYSSDKTPPAPVASGYSSDKTPPSPVASGYSSDKTPAASEVSGYSSDKTPPVEASGYSSSQLPDNS